MLEHRVGDRLHVAGHDLIELIKGQVDAMIG